MAGRQLRDKLCTHMIAVGGGYIWSRAHRCIHSSGDMTRHGPKQCGYACGLWRAKDPLSLIHRCVTSGTRRRKMYVPCLIVKHGTVFNFPLAKLVR